MSGIKTGQLRRWVTPNWKGKSEKFIILDIREALINDQPIFYQPDPDEKKIFNEVAVYFVESKDGNPILKFSEDFINTNSEIVEEDEKEENNHE